MKKLIIVSLVVLLLAGTAGAVKLQNVYARYSFDAAAPLAESMGACPDLVLTTVTIQGQDTPTVGVAAGYSGEAFECLDWGLVDAFAREVCNAPFEAGFSGGEGHIVIDMWVSLVETPGVGNWGTFFGGTGASYDLFIGEDAGGAWLGFWSYDTQGIGALKSDPLTWNADQWYNLTFVADETNNRIYIMRDGVEVATHDIDESVDMSAFSQSSLGTIGSHSNGNDGIKGKIDELRIGQIPEPATICLLGLGGLLLRRKR